MFSLSFYNPTFTSTLLFFGTTLPPPTFRCDSIIYNTIHNSGTNKKPPSTPSNPSLTFHSSETQRPTFYRLSDYSSYSPFMFTSSAWPHLTPLRIFSWRFFLFSRNPNVFRMRWSIHPHLFRFYVFVKSIILVFSMTLTPTSAFKLSNIEHCQSSFPGIKNQWLRSI